MRKLAEAIDKTVEEVLAGEASRTGQEEDDKALVDEALRVGALASAGIRTEFAD